MPHDDSPRRPVADARWVGLLVLVALALAAARWAGPFVYGVVTDAAGRQGVRQYTAPKAEAPEKVGLLGVIYPHGDLTWFFKLMGPESAVSAQADAVNDFLKSVHFTDQGDRPMEWKLPEGWQPVADAKANNPGHYATLRIESKDKPSLEMTVTKFPGTVGGLLANVNRWRGQVGLSPIEENELDRDTRKEEFNGNPTTVVKLVGPGSKPGSGTPFMNLPAAAGPDKTPFHYTKPDGWEEVADAGGPIVRAAVFKVKDGDQSAEVTVTPLPGDAGGLLPNVNRWRGQLKLDPFTEAQLKDFPKVDVAGASVSVVDTGEGAGRQRILGAVVPHAGGTWFFKMTGPSDVVEKQKSRFTDFLKSVTFGADKGGDK